MLFRLFSKTGKDNQTDNKGKTLNEVKNTDTMHAEEFDIAHFEEELRKDVSYLISQISYIHTNKDQQGNKRRDAYLNLAKLGINARKAIPILIEKRFSVYDWERSLAKDVLIKIDEKWFEDEFALDKIDFLIQKLIKENETLQDTNHAIEILSLIGRPAQERMIKIINAKHRQDDDDQILKIFSFLKKQGTSTFELLPGIHEVLAKSTTSSLLILSMEIITSLNHELLNNYENSVTSLRNCLDKIKMLVNNKSEEVQIYAIKAIDKFSANEQVLYIDEALINSLIKCLSSDSTTVSEASVEVLSKIEHKLADEYYDNILFTKGYATEHALKKYNDKINMYLKKSELGHMLITENEFYNNIFWLLDEYNKQMNKPNDLLNNVLRIKLKKKVDVNKLLDIIKNINSSK